jgi:hypothetical protein
LLFVYYLELDVVSVALLELIVGVQLDHQGLLFDIVQNFGFLDQNLVLSHSRWHLPRVFKLFTKYGQLLLENLGLLYLLRSQLGQLVLGSFLFLLLLLF